MSGRSFTFRQFVFVALAILGLGAGSAPLQAQEPYTDVQLSPKIAGRAYPLALSAQNRNCGQPLDFRFISRTPWLKLPADPVARQIPQGQTRDVQATIDLSAAAPGPHQGFVDVECENCGWFIFQTCKADKQQVRILFDVIAAGPAGGPPRIDADDPQIPAAEADRLRKARKAYDVAVLAKGPCEEKLVKLRAAAGQAAQAAEEARRAAEAAEQKAKEAKAAAEAARKKVEDAVDKVNKAQRAAEDAAAALEKALKSPATTTDELKEAKAADAAAKADLEAAQKALKDAQAQEQKALDALKAAASEAERKRVEAGAAAKAAKAAADALAAAEAECLKLQKAADAAKAAQDQAEKDAAAARDKANPPPPPAPPAPNLEDELLKAQKALNECNRKKGELLEAQRRALEALAALGALRSQTGGEDGVNEWASLAFGIASGIAEAVNPVWSTYNAGSFLDVLQATYGLFKIYQATLTPGMKQHTDPDATKKFLQDKGYATGPGEANRVYDQMKSYMDAGRSTSKMQEDLKRVNKECSDAEKAVDKAQENAKAKN